MYLSDKLFQRSREGYFSVYFPSCEATREINTKITLEWAQKQFITRIHTSFHFLHDIMNHKWDKTTIFSHRPRVLLPWFSFCWWCHNRLLMMSQWPDNCDVITWIMISILFTAIFTAGRLRRYTKSGIAQLKKCMCPRGTPPKFLCAFMRFYVPF